MPQEPTQTVRLDKDSKKELISALSDIRRSITEASTKPTTVGEKAAAKLAGDPQKGLFSALRESLSERAGEKRTAFKQMMDPVNIVKQLTGGSKLAAVLTAKALGRPQEEIRKEAGLTPLTADEPTPIPTSKDGRDLGGSAADLLKTLNIIAVRVDSIAGVMGAKAKTGEGGRLHDPATGRFLSRESAKQEEAVLNTLREIKDSQQSSYEIEKKLEEDEKNRLKLEEKNAKLAEELRDAARESSLEGKTTGATSPTLMRTALGTDGAVIPTSKKPEGGEGSGLFNTLLQTAGIVGTGALLKKGYTVAKGFGGKILEKVGLKTGAAAAEAGAELAGKAGTTAATKVGTEVAEKAGATAATKVGTEVAEKAGKEGVRETIKKSFAKLAPKKLLGAVGKSIPVLGTALGLGMAIGRLVKGDMVGAGLEAVSGLGSMVTAIPATVASLVRDVYTDVYKIPPEKDPDVERRLPELKQMVEASAAEFLQKKGESAPEQKTPESPTPEVTSPPTPTPASPTPEMPTIPVTPGVPSGEVPVPPPTPTPVSESPIKPKTELSVEEWAQDIKQRQKEMGIKTVEPGTFEPPQAELTSGAPKNGSILDTLSKMLGMAKSESGTSTAGKPAVNNTNIVNNTTPQTILMSGLPQPRSTESTWMRRQQESQPYS